MNSVLDDLEPILSDRGMLRNPATATALINWVHRNARDLSRREHFEVAVTRMLLYAQALKGVLGDPDRQVEVGGTLLDFLDGIIARGERDLFGQTLSFRDGRSDVPGEIDGVSYEGKFLDDGTLLEVCPKCGLPSIVITIHQEILYMHRVRVMPHGYDSLDHCTVLKEDPRELV